jgi:AcrR family transcriptional regulator
MAQCLKDAVELRIRCAALEVFAQRGFASASVKDIARAAGVSTGNVYRYFESKEVLFEAVVPRELAARLLLLLRRRVRALRGVRALSALAATAPFFALAEELLVFSIRHRLELVILLGHTHDGIHQGFAERVIGMLERLALRHFGELDPSRVLTAETRFVLRLVYENFVRSLVEILANHEQEAAIRAAVAAHSNYHLAGLNGLMSSLGP